MMPRMWSRRASTKGKTRRSNPTVQQLTPEVKSDISATRYHQVLSPSFILSPSWSGMLCPPSWACLPACFQSCLPAFLPSCLHTGMLQLVSRLVSARFLCLFVACVHLFNLVLSRPSLRWSGFDSSNCLGSTATAE